MLLYPPFQVQRKEPLRGGEIRIQLGTDLHRAYLSLRGDHTQDTTRFSHGSACGGLLPARAFVTLSQNIHQGFREMYAGTETDYQDPDRRG